MNRRNRHHRQFLKTLKDYFAPIALGVGIFTVGMYAIFAKGDVPALDTPPPPPLHLVRNSPQTQATLEYADGKKTKIDSDIAIERSEKLLLSSETARLQNSNVVFNMSPGELSYDGDTTYTLLSGNLWVEPKNLLAVRMRYLNVQANTDSIFSLSQNEVTSSVYVVQGSVDITTNSGASSKISKGERIVITKAASEDTSLDLVAERKPIDEITKNDEWFRINNAATYLAASSTPKAATTPSAAHTGEAGYIDFSNSLFDRAEINTPQLDIAGNIHDERITAIEIDGKNADIDTVAQTFVVR